MIMSLPEEDLTCPICCDIFTDPVLLPCSHSFCRSCLKHCWVTGLRECPVCRKKARKKSTTSSNLALKNICEAWQIRRENSLLEEKIICDLHEQKLKLFCVVDKQPICVVCQASKLHQNHDCLPVEEVAKDCKEELSVSLESSQQKLENLKRIHLNSAALFQYIKAQALEMQRVIKNQFEELHQILYQEESRRIAALKKEEEEKTARIKYKFKELSADVLSLTETISVIQEHNSSQHLHTLKNAPFYFLGSDDMSGLLIDVTKHICNLKYRVWEKILEDIDYTPVTLDPNTAHPCLVLSDDLTSLHYTKQSGCCPDNPERFHISAEVVGMTALSSGSHIWVVETGSNQDWLLGVASSSASRDVEVCARPENGFWALCFRDGEFRAMTSPPTPLTVARTPEQIKVHLDYNKGTLSFFDTADDTLIYEFAHTFTEPLLPYFYTQSRIPTTTLMHCRVRSKRIPST
uniref:Uncharacterized protein n=1 Tax=Mola mola TaxID=94237 RepID=A0A3Q3WZB4_MOLML